MTETYKLSIEDVDAYITYCSVEGAEKMLPVRIAIQLADTMRENERLRNAIGNLEPLRDFDWHGKWRIHGCLDAINSSKHTVTDGVTGSDPRNLRMEVAPSPDKSTKTTLT